MRRRVCSIALLLGGCARVFGLGRESAGPADASIDAGPDSSDARDCGTHDEDGDGWFDLCDDCPADSDPAQTDTDGDGVGDACDPAPATPGDHILLFMPFTGAGGYIVSGGITRPGLDEVDLSGTATLLASGAYTATRVEAGVQFAKATASDYIEVFAGLAGGHILQCYADDQDPACLSIGGPCVGVGYDSFNPVVASFPPIAMTDTLRLDIASGGITCTAGAGTQSAVISTVPGAQMQPGNVGVITYVHGAGDEAILTYLIVYGR